MDALKDNGIDLRSTRTIALPEAQTARKAKDLAGGNETYKAALDQLVQLPGMTPAMLEKFWEVRGTAEAAFTVLADPNKDLADQVGALKDLNAAIKKNCNRAELRRRPCRLARSGGDVACERNHRARLPQR